MKTYIYYDDQDVLCYFAGSYLDFCKFMEENPDYTKD